MPRMRMQDVLAARTGSFAFPPALWPFGAGRAERADRVDLQGCRVLVGPGELALGERLEAWGCSVTRIATPAQAALVLTFSSFDLFAIEAAPEDRAAQAVIDTVGRLAPLLPLLVHGLAPREARPLLRGWGGVATVVPAERGSDALRAEVAALAPRRPRAVVPPLR